MWLYQQALRMSNIFSSCEITFRIFWSKYILILPFTMPVWIRTKTINWANYPSQMTGSGSEIVMSWKNAYLGDIRWLVTSAADMGNYNSWCGDTLYCTSVQFDSTESFGCKIVSGNE